jgi:citrate lyase subunit beta/citryl-CoA lyase
VIEAAAKAEKEGVGVIALDGKMIDAPIVSQAQRVLQRAEASGIRR